MVRGKILRRRACSFDQLENRRVLDGTPLVGGVTFPYDDVDRLVIDDVLGPDVFMDDGFAPIDFLTLLTPNDPVSNPEGISLPTSSFDRFPLEQIQDRFFLFDNMAPYNAPDFAGEYGLAPLRLFTQWFFWPVGAGPEPDIERLLSKIPHLDARQPVVVDIEHWPTAVSDSDEELRESVRKLTTILDTIKQQRPDVTVGLYRTVPTREYRAPVFHGMGSPEYALWQAHNSERVAEIAKHVDIIVPSLYTFYPDYESDGSLRLFERDRWVTYATANIAEARQYGKPVVPYILPYYTPSRDPNRYWQSEEISPGFWETILNTVHDQADSAVIWTGRYEWADNPGWWPVTEQFANDVLPVMAESETTALGQIEFGSYWQTRGSEAATIHIEVNPINDAPNAKNDTEVHYDFNPLTLNLLADNGSGADSDIDGSIVPSTLVINTLPAHGQVENHLDGTVTYTPNDNHIGADTFTYTISDNNGAISNPATVTINTIVNRPPVAVNDLITVNKNSQVTFHVANSNTLGADSDPDGNLDRMSPFVVSVPTHGTVVNNTADGSFTYTPNAGFFGNDQFTYRILDTDGAESNVATVQLFVRDVNAAPIANNDMASVDEDETIIITSLAANDTDSDGNVAANTLTIQAAPTHGSATVDANGIVTYTPHANFYGADSFTYRIKDNSNALSNIATVSITVNSVNDPPVAYADSIFTPESTSVTFNVFQAHQGLADTDIDNALANALVEPTSGPANGTLENLGAGEFRYTPNSEFHGLDTFQYRAVDADSAQSDPVVVSIFVNSAPIANHDIVTLDEDTTIQFSLVAGTGADLDPDGTLELDSIEIVSPPTFGEITEITNGEVVYQPDADFFGADTFTYQIRDNDGALSNVATVSLTVHSVNDLPVARNDSLVTAIGYAIQFSPLADNGHGADQDVEDHSNELQIEFQQDSQGHVFANGTLTDLGQGTFEYSPNVGFAGFDTATYRIVDSDGGASSFATLEIEVADINVAPIANDDTAETLEDADVVISALSNDIDPKGTIDVTSVQVVNTPQHGVATVQPDGTVIYSPNLDHFGTDEFRYVVFDSDGAISNEATVQIQIQAVNDAPVAGNNHLVVGEDNVITFGLTGNDFDVDGTVSPSQVQIETMPDHGSLTFDGSQFRYQPDADYHGNDSFTYRLRDAQDAELFSNTATVTIEVTSINDTPVAFDDVAHVSPNLPTVIDVFADNGNGPDTDVDTGTVPTSASMVTSTRFGDLTYSGNGQFYYVPHINYVGIDSFEYVAEDSQGGTSQVAEVTIVVNTPPVAADDFAYVSVNTEVTIDVRQTNTQDGTQDLDVDGNLGDATAVIDAPVHGVLTEIAAGVFRYIPNLDFVGEDAFTYQLTDELGAKSNLATVRIYVTNQRQLPVAIDDTVATREGTPRVFSVVEPRIGGNDYDPDGTLDLVSISVVDPPTNGTIEYLGQGEFRYSPHLDFYGEDSFTYTVSDDDSQISNLATVTIQVVEANIPPLLSDRVVTVDEDSVVTFSLLADSMDLDGSLLPSSVIHVAWPSSGILRIVSTGVYSYTPNKDFHGVDSFSFQAQDNLGAYGRPVEVIRESLSTDGSQSELDHRWRFELGSRMAERLYVSGFHDSDAEGFTFEYSTDQMLWLPTNIQLSKSPEYHEFVFGESVSGTVWIRAVDLNRQDGETSLDAVYVEDLQLQATRAIRAATSSITIDDVQVNESDGQATFRVTRSGDLTQVSSVLFKVLPGTAVEGEDYQRMLPASLSFAPFVPEMPDETPPESESLFITVPLIDDLLAEDAEEFSIELVPLHNAQLVRDRATAVIQRNDGQAPLAIDDAITTWEDTPVELDLLAPNPDQADSTPQGELDPTSLQIVSPPSHGTLSVNLDGTWLFTPGAEYFGTDTFTYKVTDTLGFESNIATVTLEITEVDDPPMIQDVTFSIDENSPNGTVVGQLEIVDVDGGEPFSVVLSAGNLEGTFALNELHQIIVANSNHLDAEQNTSFDLVVDVVVNETVADSALVQVNVQDVADGLVVGRHIFYNNSSFDGNHYQANEADDLAIAPGPSDASSPELGKTALLPGHGPATFQNYTSYSRGINGVMVDIRDLATLPSIETWDQFFEFRVGNSSTTASWTSAPAPIDLLARPGAGIDGSTRITLVWADNAIQQQWLQINVLQNNVTGLSQMDTHYWGNAIGETGLQTGSTTVNGSDLVAARDNPTFLVSSELSSRFDFNRDRRVNGTDIIIVRDNMTFLVTLHLLVPT